MAEAAEGAPPVALVDPAGEKKSRSRSRGRDRDRDRERRKKDRRSRTRSRSRGRRERERRRRRSRSGEKSRKRRARTPTPEREERRRMEAEREGKRDSFTVFVSAIHPKNDERDLFEFFSLVGQVEDIRLIRDQRTSKSKGLAYIEFWDQNCVQMAIALSGQLLGGHPITIALTPQAQQEAKEEEAKAMKLYIGSIHEDLSEEDLKGIFVEFGELDGIELQRDPASGKSQGYGFVTFKNEMHAKAALRDLNGMELAGRPIQIRTVDAMTASAPAPMALVPQVPAPGPDVGIGELDDMGGGGFKMNANSRIALMQKLQRNSDQLPSAQPAMGMGGPPPAAAMSMMAHPTPCLLIKNMFDPREETDKDFHLDIQEDVKDECSNHGVVKHCVADKNSAGFVYLKFDSIPSAQRCFQALNGRYFAKRQIQAEFMTERDYSIKFPSA